MAKKKTSQKSTGVGSFALKDKIALTLSAMTVCLAGYQVYLAKKQSEKTQKA